MRLFSQNTQLQMAIPSAMLKQRPVSLRVLILRALYILTANIPSTVSAVQITSQFQRRQDSQVCGASNLSPCNLSGLPKDLCCTEGSYCLVGAVNTTIICCPEGAGCEAIRPIVCDLNAQDPNQAPESLVKTILLGGSLPVCGNGCCPWGYTCDTTGSEGAVCRRDEDQNKFPDGAVIPGLVSSSQSSTATSLSVVPTSIIEVTPTSILSSTLGATSTAAPVVGDSEDTEEEGDKQGSEDDGNNTGLIAGVVVGAITLSIIIAAGIFCCVRTRRKNKSNNNSHTRSASSPHHHHLAEHKRSTSSSFGNFISEPIMAPDTLRSDFGRVKETDSTSTIRVISKVSSSKLTTSDINRYWAQDEMPPRMGLGPNIGIAMVGSAKGRAGPPQIGEIDMGLRATTIVSSRGTTPGPRSRSSVVSSVGDPFRYDGEDEEVSPSTITVVPPIRGMLSSHGSAKRNNNKGVSSRPFTPQQSISNKRSGKKYAYRPREPSGTEIDVFADPATLADSPNPGAGRAAAARGGLKVRDSVGTTFTTMMEKASLGDVARGAPYVPRSAHGTPSRGPRR